jgi:hypothetical protein
MDVTLCSGLESVHNGATEVFKNYAAANHKYCPKNFEDFYIQPDVQGNFGSDGFVSNYFVV